MNVVLQVIEIVDILRITPSRQWGRDPQLFHSGQTLSLLIWWGLNWECFRKVVLWCRQRRGYFCFTNICFECSVRGERRSAGLGGPRWEGPQIFKLQTYLSGITRFDSNEYYGLWCGGVLVKSSRMRGLGIQREELCWTLRALCTLYLEEPFVLGLDSWHGRFVYQGWIDEDIYSSAFVMRVEVLLYSSQGPWVVFCSRFIKHDGFFVGGFNSDCVIGLAWVNIWMQWSRWVGARHTAPFRASSMVGWWLWSEGCRTGLCWRFRWHPDLVYVSSVPGFFLGLDGYNVILRKSFLPPCRQDTDWAGVQVWRFGKKERKGKRKERKKKWMGPRVWKRRK